jgi:hypothetical protein
VGRNWNGGGWRINVGVNLGNLTGDALFCPAVDVVGDAWPQERALEVTGSSDPRVSEGRRLSVFFMTFCS